MKILEVFHSEIQSEPAAEAHVNSTLKVLTEKFPFLKEMEVVSLRKKDVPDLLQEMQAGGFGACKLHPDFYPHQLKKFSHRTQQVQDVGCFDFVELKNGHYWPSLLLWQQLKNVLVQNMKHVDFNGVAYVVGSNHVATCALTDLVHLGFKKIRWIIHDDDFLPEDINAVQRKFFGIQLEILSSAKLSSQAVDGTILINTVSFENRAEMLQDISYFNFIRQDSFVVDVDLCRTFEHRFRSLLIQEAKEVGLHIIPAPIFMYEVDMNIIERYLTLTETQKTEIKDFYLNNQDSKS